MPFRPSTSGFPARAFTVFDLVHIWGQYCQSGLGLAGLWELLSVPEEVSPALRPTSLLPPMRSPLWRRASRAPVPARSAVIRGVRRCGEPVERSMRMYTRMHMPPVPAIRYEEECEGPLTAERLRGMRRGGGEQGRKSMCARKLHRTAREAAPHAATAVGELPCTEASQAELDVGKEVIGWTYDVHTAGALYNCWGQRSGAGAENVLAT
ncbi:hypothetical protein FB451DRAFT_1366839 [Mycena latifolia]|nr:hypothetical protein FB451DRAFT_1366839 [Mycena latifolia]